LSHNYTLINYFLLIKDSIKNLVFSYLYEFFHYSFTPAIVLLGILYLINTYTSDGNTRNHNNNNAEDNNGENNQNVNLPPPPPPTLEQVLAMQAQMLQTMQQTMVNMQVAQPQVC
jgi:hypothetical protein